MSITFVSSMNNRLYEMYGKRFAEEFSNYASNDLVLNIIFEGKIPSSLPKLNQNVNFIDFNSVGHRQFIRFFSPLKEISGLKLNVFEENGEKKVSITPSWRFDAIRFSFKPFAIQQSIEYLDKKTDYLIWIDADIRCKKNFNKESLLQFLPNSNELMSYLGRKNSHSECGFLAFNLKHLFFHQYIDRIINIYLSGEIFSLDEWHDSWIWDFARFEFEKKNNVSFKNISGNGYEKQHVFIHSGLEEFFDHLKGPARKRAGTSY